MARIKTKITNIRIDTETQTTKTDTTIIKGISSSRQGGTSKWWRWRGSIKTSQWILTSRPSREAMCLCKFSSSRSLFRTVRPSATGDSTGSWTDTSVGETGISRMNLGLSRAVAEGGWASTEWRERHNPSTKEWMLTWLLTSQFRARDKLGWMIMRRIWRLTLRSLTFPLIWAQSHCQYLYRHTNKLPKANRSPQITSCHPIQPHTDLIINSH